jgi:RNA polymerase sigma-70 factor, ECF subfamily
MPQYPSDLLPWAVELAPMFLGGLVGLRDGGPLLEERLAELWRDVQAAWPGVAVPAERFLPYLAARLPAGGTAVDALERMLPADLYLACGCVDGDRAALAAFEAHPMKEVSALVRRMTSATQELEDASQIIRMRLFTSDGTQPPGIAGYAGSGPLRLFLRVTVVRELYKVLGRAARETPLEPEDLADLPAVEDDPELAHLKRLYRDEFKEGFEASLASLDRRDRTLLRYHYVQRLTIDEIGVLLRVHRATAARRLADVRQELRERTREHMIAKLTVAKEDLQSILRLIESQLHASVVRLLA